jgi:multidrug efflux system outer membrane protein
MIRSRLYALPAAAAATLCLAGCVALSRPPDTVAAPTPPQWYAPLPHGGTLADLTLWWRQFEDPLLVELIEAAQAVSPTVATAGARIADARAIRTGAQAALLPTLDAALSASRGNAQTGAPLATTGQAGLQTAWEIDLFGGNQALAEAARARLDSEQAGWHAARVAVAAETALTYLNLRSCERQLAVVVNDATSRNETSRLTNLSAEAGFTAPAVAALARASAAEGNARVTQFRAQCDSEVKALVALSGLAEPQLRTRLATAWTEPVRFALAAVAPVPATLLLQRPDVYQAEREVAAASADVGAARADRMPRLTLTGQVGRAAIHAGGSTNSLDTWSIGPVALTLPLFDGGRRAANEEAAAVRYETAVALYGARVRQAVREVEEALLQLDSARLRSEDARVAAEGYRASFTASEARYRGGLGSLIEMEDQRRIALGAELALVNLQRERIAAWIALYRAVGGGWARPDGAATALR